jgi:hypothetical protein
MIIGSPGTGNSTVVPIRVKVPIFLLLFVSVNQTARSGPTVIDPKGSVVFDAKSVIAPFVFI